MQINTFHYFIYFLLRFSGDMCGCWSFEHTGLSHSHTHPYIQIALRCIFFHTSVYPTVNVAIYWALLIYACAWSLFNYYYYFHIFHYGQSTLPQPYRCQAFIKCHLAMVERPENTEKRIFRFKKFVKMLEYSLSYKNIVVSAIIIVCQLLLLFNK